MSAELFHSLIAREPMLITLDGAVSFAARLRCDVPRDQKPNRNFLGDTVPQMRIEGGTAYVPIIGPMIKNAGFLLKGFGAVAHEDIATSLDEAASSSSVSRIVLLIDSPGGTATGTPELADKIANIDAKKPVYAFTDSLAASAAFWIAASARGIYATKSARVGSIGALLEVTNFSEALKARGIAVDVFTSSPLKSAGHPARPMTDEARQYFQGQVDSIGNAFRSFVSEHRRGANPSSMTGAVFFGQEAVAQGLVDGIVPSANAMFAGGEVLSPSGSSRSAGAANSEFPSREIERAYSEAVTQGRVRIHGRKSASATRDEFPDDFSFQAYQRACATGRVR